MQKKSVSRLQKYLTYSKRRITQYLILLLHFFSLLVFTLKYYIFKNGLSIDYFGISSVGTTLFYLNFYIFFFIFLFFIFLSFKSNHAITKYFSLYFALGQLALSGICISDLFIIKVPAFICWLLAANCILSFPKNLFASLTGSALFLLLQFHYGFMGTDDYYFDLIEPSLYEILSTAVIFVSFSVLISFMNLFYTRWHHASKAVTHMNKIMSQMGEFNRCLQENTFTREEEAATQERLRITREIHDSAGYVFVNIIALMDAVLSGGCQNQSEEFFETVKKQASDGLQETRRVLRQLRAVEDHPLSSIDSIYRLKNLFERVTDITVDIETGNIQKDYGSQITKILSRIVQESFTNSVRHGHATHILIQFWQFETTLSMTLTDNGHGATSIVKGIGLAGMEERLALVSGTLKTSTPREGGFRIQITIPLTQGDNS